MLFALKSGIIGVLSFDEGIFNLAERYLGYGSKILEKGNHQLKMKGKKMSMSKEKKQAIIAEYATSKGDTGSPEVQVALLTEEIKALSEHLKNNKKDFHSARGLMARVANRRRLLAYLKKTDQTRYDALVKRLKLRK